MISHPTYRTVIRFVIAALACTAGHLGAAENAMDVAPVWSGHPVGFALLTHDDHQFVAFYDAERRMTVGVRRLSPDLDGPEAAVTSEPPGPQATLWHFVHLPEKLGWDSHNYVTLAIDYEGNLHLSGNMHCVPLVYFRTRRPLDIDTFERIPHMVGQREQRVTYPVFFRGPGDALIFTYRDGSSGNGDQLYNVYDPAGHTWRRLVDGPIISGEGLMNAYIQGPSRAPDGNYHLAWVWRDTPDCATNHDLSYARSRDLIHWETSRGQPLELPITIKTAEIVDPVPAGGGLLNSNARLAFDKQSRPVISYHKYDSRGALQIYNARLEGDHWNIQRASDWTWRYEFSGGGSIGAQVRVFPVELTADGFRQRYENAVHGTGTWRLNAATLKPLPPSSDQRKSDGRTELLPASADIPPAILATRPVSTATQPALVTRTAGDLGRSAQPGISYRLQWETLPPNRDRRRPGPPPAPTMLKLVITRRK